MILQVHDELIFEVPKTELKEMESLVGELMPSAVTLEVPLEIEMKTGSDWGNCVKTGLMHTSLLGINLISSPNNHNKYSEN